MRILVILRIVGAAILLPVIWVLTRPLKFKRLSFSNPVPTDDYGIAVHRIKALQARDTPDIQPLCRLQFMTHGRKVERAIVFWHGFTSCPQQFHHLGQIFYELGYNVLIPRLPHHGSIDRLGPDQTQLTAEKLISLVDEVVDLAHGLGDHLTVAGFSGGGVLAGWTAQHRPDIDRVVIIAASFGLKVIPTPLITSAVKLLLTWPNSFQWWDPKLRTEVQGPPYGYWRFSTRALGQILRLGLAVRSAARRSKPAVGSILVVTNANDWAVDNPLAAEIVSRWRNNGASNVQIYEFPAELNLLHDLLPPEYPAQRVDMVYPILVDLINNQPQAGAAANQELS